MSKASLTIWRCSDNAKHADFGIRTRKPNIFRHQNDATGKICPYGKRSGFRYRVAEKFAEITVFEIRLLLCPVGFVLRYNKQGTCTASSKQTVSFPPTVYL